MKKLVRMNGISDEEDGGQNLNVIVQDQEEYFIPGITVNLHFFVKY